MTEKSINESTTKTKIKYYIPDFFWKFNTNLKLLELMNTESQMFYDDVEIGAVFGNYPNCIWNGGSVFWGRHVDKSEMIEISARYNAYGVPLRLTMTNPLIEEKHLSDTYANYIMRNTNNGFNQVLVSNPILEEYIRKEYPEYPIVRSILAAKDVYYDDSDKYFMSVLRKHKNNDFELLKNIKHKEKIEMLANETCEENCPRAYTHYLEYAKNQLGYGERDELQMDCSFERKHQFQKMKQSPLCISREKIKEVYEPMGFTNFKLSGRGTGGDVVISYANHMVKPEWKDDFLSIMMNSIIADNR